MRRATGSWFLAASLLCACGGERPAAPVEGGLAIDVPVEVLKRRPAAVIYPASGTVRSRNTASLAAKVVGRVLEVRVEAGTAVKKGDLLVALEASEAEASLGRAKAGAAEAEQGRREAEGGLRAAAADLALAQTTGERFRMLIERGAVSRQEFDEAESRQASALAAHEMAAARLGLATSRVDLSRAESAAAQARLADHQIRSPFSGRVLERRVEAGNLAAPGVPLLVIGEDGRSQVEASVDESHSGRIAAGDAATVVLGSGAGAEVTGTVREVDAGVDPATRTFRVKVDLPGDVDPGRLTPGAFARVLFSVGTSERLLLPEGAVVHHGQIDSVFVVDGERARSRIVTLGARRGDRVEVLAGLGDGESVVRTGAARLTDGCRVRIVP